MRNDTEMSLCGLGLWKAVLVFCLVVYMYRTVFPIFVVWVQVLLYTLIRRLIP